MTGKPKTGLREVESKSTKIHWTQVRTLFKTHGRKSKSPSQVQLPDPFKSERTDAYFSTGAGRINGKTFTFSRCLITSVRTKAVSRKFFLDSNSLCNHVTCFRSIFPRTNEVCFRIVKENFFSTRSSNQSVFTAKFARSASCKPFLNLVDLIKRSKPKTSTAQQRMQNRVVRSVINASTSNSVRWMAKRPT